MARIGWSTISPKTCSLTTICCSDSSITINEIEFRQSEIAAIKFPLKLAEVAQVDSKTSPAVQLADVMIGAAIEAGNNLAGLRSGGPDPGAVMSLYAENQFIHLTPSTDFEEQRRFRQGTQAAEVIDYFA